MEGRGAPRLSFLATSLASTPRWYQKYQKMLSKVFNKTFREMFKIPTFGIPTFIIPIEKYSHNTNAPIIIPMPLSKYQCPYQNTNDTRSKYQWKVRNTNKLKRVRFINSKYQQVGILNTVHNTNPSPQNNHLGACCWAATSSRWQAWPCQEEERQEGR